MADMSASDAADLAVRAMDWVLNAARDNGDGLVWGEVPGGDPDPWLYGGTAGTVVGLLEAFRHFGDGRYAEAARRGAITVAEAVPDAEENGYYSGRAGLAVVLKAAADALGDSGSRHAAENALALVRADFDGMYWNDTHFDVYGGNAGIALAALHCGDSDLAVRAVLPYLPTAEYTEHGATWAWAQRRYEARLHHFSHGTMGIAYALLAVGHATGRADLVELGLLGVADVTARNEDGERGFLVPHSDPAFFPNLVARYSYGWCHGPAGDANVFRLLRDHTGEAPWQSYVDRCWHTVLNSGLPERIRPGFWDNQGRCCGTAGVLAFANDRMDEAEADGDAGAAAEARAFADVLVADLTARAITDEAGTRWSNHAHDADPPADLEPRIGWAQGNAGIVRELLRYVRITTGGDAGYAVELPEQPAVGR